VKTEIEFLRDLEGDLMTAARRDTASASAAAPGRGVRRPRRLSVRAVGALAAAVLTLSGIVGFLQTRPGASDGVRDLGAQLDPTDAPAGAPSSSRAVARLSHGAVRNSPDIGFSGFLEAGDEAVSRGSLDGAAQYSIDRSAGTQGATGGPTHGQTRQDVGGIGPRVVKTARVEIRVPKGTSKDRFDQAVRIADTFGGYVQSSSTAGEELRSGGLLLRIPVEDFERALGALRGLGTIEHQQVDGRDITQDFVDLGARLRNALAEEARLRAFLAQAPTVESSLRVNQTLSQVELQIEQLRGQLRYLQHRSDLSTIDVELSERAPQKAQPAPAPKPTHESLGGAWHRAVDAFFAVATSVVAGLGYVVPIAGLVLIAAVVLWLITRRVRQRILA
jgi:Domain of unknown function (DUF4349)